MTVVDFSLLDRTSADDNSVVGERKPRRAFRRMGKKMAEQTVTAEETARKEALDAAQKAADETNSKRTGKGTRLSVSSTRGRQSTPVTYESFNEDVAGSLPESIQEFMELSGVDDEAQIVSFLVTGYNDFSFRKASDPVQEYINPVWPSEVAKSFADSVKTLVKNGVMELEAAVALIKPQVDKKFAPATT